MSRIVGKYIIPFVLEFHCFIYGCQNITGSDKNNEIYIIHNVFITEAVTVDDIITDDMMEQKELVTMEQRKDEGNDQLKHWELTKEPHLGT